MPLSKEDTQRAVSILESLLSQLHLDDICTPDQQSVGDDNVIHGDDLSDLRRLQSAADMMRSPLFSAIVDIRSQQAKDKIQHSGHESTPATSSDGRTAATATTNGVATRTSGSAPQPMHLKQTAGLSSGTVWSLPFAAVTTTEGNNGFSSFVLRSTFASGDRLSWDSDTSLTDDTSISDSQKSTDKSSPPPPPPAAGSSQAMKPKKPSWKASTSSAPLKRGGGERRRRGGGRKDVKVKSEKKPSSLTLGRRKGREGGKSGSSGGVVTLADLAQSVPRSISRASSSTSGGMESPSIRNGSMGHGDQTVWKGSMELELYDAATPSSGSRKSCYSQEEEESSLSELSALIDSISVQSEPLLTDTGHRSSVATTIAVEKQATVIRNYDAHSSESVDQVETTDTLTNKCPLVLTGEGAEQQDNIAMATIVIENRDTMSCNSVPGTPLNAKAVSKEGTSLYSSDPLDSPRAKERSWDLKTKSEAETAAATCTATVIENRDAENTTIASSEPIIATTQHDDPRDLELKEGTCTTSIPESADLERDRHTSVDSDDVDTGNSKKSVTSAKRRHAAENGSQEIIDKGIEGNLRGGQKKQLPKDILFFMRDQQSQTQLKQVLEGMHGRSRRTVALEVHDVPSIAGGGANIGIDIVGLSSTGVFVGGVSRGSSAEGSKVKTGDQILEVNGRKIENMASFEVDMLLSEAAVGEKVHLTLQYNPSGLAEYHRIQRKRH